GCPLEAPDRRARRSASVPRPAGRGRRVAVAAGSAPGAPSRRYPRGFVGRDPLEASWSPLPRASVARHDPGFGLRAVKYVTDPCRRVARLAGDLAPIRLLRWCHTQSESVQDISTALQRG